jgi:hypothetical protein
MSPWALAAGWYHAALLAALPWVAAFQSAWAPLVVALLVIVRPPALRARRFEPWTSAVVAASAVAFLVVLGGWAVAGGWLILSVAVAGVVLGIPGGRSGRPDAGDVALVVGWATAIAVRPSLMELDHGGWLAPLVLVLAARGISTRLHRRPGRRGDEPLPPSRSVRGTLSLRSAVAADGEGNPRTVPLDLELRAGDSLALLCDDPSDREALAELLAVRRAPLAGEVAVDGASVAPGDRVVAVVAPGERFVPGDLAANLAGLCHEELDRSQMAAITEACALSEVADALGDEPLRRDGSPLSAHHRLLLLAGRVIPSSYRLLVVVDPMPWVNSVRGELWRGAVVRASVGRTSVWITADRELAGRADTLLQVRQGALRRPLAPLARESGSDTMQ